MESLHWHEGIAALLDMKNVDTDQIIPKQFLKEISRIGFGKYLFFDWRYLPDGSENPDFVLNRDEFKEASILVAGDNFGCGSSREHAPWAIRDYGFRAVISTRFADIFYSNCFKNGILPIRVNASQLHALMSEIRHTYGVRFQIDLEKQKLSTPDGTEIHFEVDAFRKNCMLKGMDDIAWTLQYQDYIQKFEAQQKETLPWLWQPRIS